MKNFFRAFDLKSLLLLLLTAALVLLTVTQVPGINGPWYWERTWRWIDSARLYPAMLAAFLPFLLGQFLFQRNGQRSAALPLILCMISTVALELVAIGVQNDPFNVSDNIVHDVIDVRITSYFTDALRHTDVNSLLRSFDTLMDSLNVHSRNKPPGPILFSVFII